MPRAPRNGFEGAKRRRDDLAREIHDILEVAPDEVAGLAELAPDAALADMTEVEETLERLRRERERLGAVNLRAEEELKEVETQHDGLITERDDLVEAIKRLRTGIQSLNREARERLLASFEVVNDALQAPVRTRCSAAAPPSCSSSRTTIRSRPASRSSPSRPARSRRRCRCCPAASRR